MSRSGWKVYVQSARMQSIHARTCVQTTVEDKESGNTVAAVNCYFMSQDGSMFKAQVHFSPYFYLQIKVWSVDSRHQGYVKLAAASARSFNSRSLSACHWCLIGRGKLEGLQVRGYTVGMATWGCRSPNLASCAAG